jgi:uncharacterized protein (DUF58 family)
VHFFLSRRIRPTGLGIVAVFILSAILSAGTILEPMYLVLTMSFSLLLLAFMSLPFQRAKLQITRQLPRYATAGSSLGYTVTVTNQGRWGVARFGLIETPPDPRPALRTFAASREPGEEQRNLFDRHVGWYRWSWLCHKDQLFLPNPAIAEKKLTRAESRKLRMEIIPQRRGVIQLNQMRLLLPEPLGLLQRCCRVQQEPAQLIVLPRRYPMPAFDLPGSARFQPGGEATSRHSGSAGEFSGLREYQPGDPLRLIHWASWARTGKPVVKELEDTFFPRYGLILDTCIDPGAEEDFEKVVSIGASFLAVEDPKETWIDLMFISGIERVLRAGHGHGRTEPLMEALAGVQPDHQEKFADLRRLVLRHAEDLAGCLCLFTGWSRERSQLITSLQSNGISCAAIIVSAEKLSLPPHCYQIRPQTVEADLMRLPRQL